MDDRVLLLEFVNADQFPGRISGFFPFIRGYLDLHGVPARWLRFGLATTHLLEHQRDEFTLEDAELALVEAAAQELRPTLLVTTDPLYAPQLDRLRQLCPGLQVTLQEDFEGLAGRPVMGDLLDTPGATPRYDWEPGNDGARRRQVDNIYLAFRERCGHSKLAARNPFFAGLDDARVVKHRGCTFCSNWRRTLDDEDAFVTPPGWISRQVEGIARSRGQSGRLPNSILLTVLPTPRILAECLSAMRAHHLTDHGVQLMFGIRTDQAAWVTKALREAYAADPNLRAGIYASGLESFDERDLSLYNKGTSALLNVAAVNLYRALAADFPDRFSYTGLSTLLFTPWSTIEGLRLNYGVARLLGLTPREAGNLFQSRLRLHPELPITALAERDGFIVEDEPDEVLMMNRRKLFGQERPWRFADPRLRALCRIVLRYDLLESPLADELAKQVEGHLKRLPRPWRKSDDLGLIDFTQAMLEHLLCSPEPVGEEALLEAAGARLRAQAALPPRRWRVGEELLSLGDFLERLAPALKDGTAPLVAVRQVTAAEAQAVAPRVTQLGLHAERWPKDARKPGRLFVSAEAARVRSRIELEQALVPGSGRVDREAAVLRAGALHGYPECCARAYAAGRFGGEHLSGWAVVAMRAGAAEVPSALHPLWVPALGFVPCGPGCERAAAELSRRHLRIGAPPPPAERISVVSVDGAGDGECVVFLPRKADPERIAYDGAALVGGDGALRRRLAAGEALGLTPAQVRIEAGGRAVDLLTVSHLPWSANTVWHPREWCELAHGAVDGLAVERARPQVEEAPEAPQPSGAAHLRVVVVDHAARDAEYRFHVARHQEGQPYFRRVEDLVLWYERGSLTPRSQACAQAVLAVMRALGREPFEATRLERWRRAVPIVLDRAGLGSSCECRVEWQ